MALPESPDTPVAARATAQFAERTVSRIGYGALQLERLDGDGAGKLLRRAVELGVDHIDTAQFYGNGLVNEFLRANLRPDDNVVIVSKVGFDPNPGSPVPMRPAQRPEELRASVEDNLRTLGLARIPVVNLRRMDGPHRIPVSPEQVVDLDDQLAALIAMREEGLIGSFGLSSVGIDGLRQAIPAGIACVQNAYSLIARDDEHLLDLCIEEQIAWVPYFPLGSAFPGMPKVVDEPVVRAVADSLRVTASQVGLAWLLRRAPNVLLIPGTASLDHLEANIAVDSITFDDEVLALLDAIPPHAPHPIS